MMHKFIFQIQIQDGEATKPSDFLPHAVADGIIELAQGNGSYYNVVDHSDSDPPWWHSAYLFKLKFAQTMAML